MSVMCVCVCVHGTAVKGQEGPKEGAFAYKVGVKGRKTFFPPSLQTSNLQ